MQRPTNTALREALQQMVRTQRRIRDRCDDEAEEDCPYCKPAVDGQSTNPWQIFQAGPVRKPSPRARGALNQHYVIPWFGFHAEETGDQLTVHIEEWEWKRGRAGSWDGLHHAECKLIECKLGFRDFINEDLLCPVALGDPMPIVGPHLSGNPKKPWLPSLYDAWENPILAQHAAFNPDWPIVSLEWTFSDDDVRYCFSLILGDLDIFNIEARHVPYELAPTGTTFVRELYASGKEDYGYWEDN